MRTLVALTLCLLLIVAALGQSKLGGTAKIGGTSRTAISAGGGGPADFVTDTFTEASDIELSLHTPELGGPWVDHPHANYTVVTNIDAATDRIFSVSTSAYYATATPPSADYTVCADFYLHSAVLQSIGVTGRMDVTNDTMYIGRLVDGATWQMRKIVTSTQTTLGSTSTNQIPSVGNFKTGCLVMAGDQISFTVNGVTEIGPVTDAAITAAGKAGFRNNGTAATATAGTHLDNFSAQ